MRDSRIINSAGTQVCAFIASLRGNCLLYLSNLLEQKNGVVWTSHSQIVVLRWVGNWCNQLSLSMRNNQTHDGPKIAIFAIGYAHDLRPSSTYQPKATYVAG